MRNLLKYYFKKKWIRIFVLTLIVFIINLFILIFSDFIKEGYGETALNKALPPLPYDTPQNPPVIVLTIFSGILSMIVPMYEFSFKMKKINVDQYYSLPIKRSKLFFATYIFGIIEILIPITISFIYSYIYVGFSEHMFYLSNYYIYYLLLVLVTILIYTIVTFVFTRNNTILDGIINVIFINVIGVLIASSIIEVLHLYSTNALGLKSGQYWLFAPYIFASSISANLLCYNRTGYFQTSNSPQNISDNIAIIVCLSAFVILSVVCFIHFISQSKKEKAENTNNISNALCSYRVMIPLSIVTFTIVGHDFLYITIPLVTVCGYLLYCLYLRTFKIKIKYVIIMSICLGIGIYLASVANIKNIYWETRYPELVDFLHHQH